ncbi:MAG: hypothetical protein WBA83_11710 [Burkholderiaceae bacterium]
MGPVLAVLLFAPKAEGAIGRAWANRAAELRAHGFEVLRCVDMPELYLAAQGRHSSDNPAVVVLAGTQDENCTVAAGFRALHPSAGMVSLVEPGSEIAVIQALRAGVDNCCPQTGSAQLLAAMLLRLFHAVGIPQPPVAQPDDPAAANAWSLQEYGWVLLAPHGLRIELTTGERAFLSTLLATPDLRATHAQLLDAVDACNAADTPIGKQGRLGVLVSRLRRKLSANSIALPLKSVHGWGYAFTGPLRTEPAKAAVPES